jgi:hypothetical protein
MDAEEFSLFTWLLLLHHIAILDLLTCLGWIKNCCLDLFKLLETMIFSLAI